jgi:uncharacterized DUF497 family protein
MQFEWDENKNRINKTKHGVSFEVACEIWLDPKRLLLVDRDSFDEERWLAIGSLDSFAIAVAVHTYRGTEDEEIVRIISARKATPHERYGYQAGDDT